VGTSLLLDTGNYQVKLKLPFTVSSAFKALDPSNGCSLVMRVHENG